MKISLKSPLALPATVACALVAGLISVSPTTASAAIIAGSQVEIVGSADFDSVTGSINFVSLGTPPAGYTDLIRINSSGNTGSFAGLNAPNPAALPLTPNYGGGIRDLINGAIPTGGNFLLLPSVNLDTGEPGPAVGQVRFNGTSVVRQEDTFGGILFLRLVMTGTIFDLSDGTSTPGVFSLTSQNLPGVQSFSGTLEARAGLIPNPNATVIPVPAAAWMLGSGLLAMVAASRRRRNSDA